MLKLSLSPHHVMHGLKDWAETHMDEVLANREEDDARVARKPTISAAGADAIFSNRNSSNARQPTAA